MTSLTQATSLSFDPGIRAAEIKAMRDSIREILHDANLALTSALESSTGGYKADAECNAKSAVRHFARADRLQRRLDELERGQ